MSSHSFQGIETFKQVEDLFSRHGVHRLFIKQLAPNQDNEKNQVYLASGGKTNSILNAFSAELSYRSASTSTSKSRSSEGTPKIEMLLNFSWLTKNGIPYRAPHAKIINYFQYPEARFSGFLKSCDGPPDAMRRDRQDLYGKRVLVLGPNDSGETFGLVLTERDDPVVSKFPDFPVSRLFPALHEHIIGAESGRSSRELLIAELTQLSGMWHPSITLKPRASAPIPFRGNQGAGFTLEALLKVARNSDKAPDKHGFELKAFQPSGRISLMTPTADLGFEGKSSFREFMQRYGWQGANHIDRRVFNGTFKYQTPKRTLAGHRLALGLSGFNSAFTALDVDDGSGSVDLRSLEENLVASGWSFQKLLDGWQEKHASACYVEYEKRPYTGCGNQHDHEYRFTGRLMVCEGTSIWNFIKGIAARNVYYDPGHEIRADGASKQRPQWRISVTKKFHSNLQSLYDEVEELRVV
jgi:hypothetical protein